MLEHMFLGNPSPPMTMSTLTEPPWTMAELRHANIRKRDDDVGLVAEFLKHSPDDFRRFAARNERSAHNWKCPILLAGNTLQDASEDKGSEVRA